MLLLWCFFVVSIGRESFSGTIVDSLTIPQKVSTIETRAFADATQLKDVYFAGHWGKDVGGDLFAGCAANLMIHYIKGKEGYEGIEYQNTSFPPVIIRFDNNNDEVFATPTDDQIISPNGDYVIEPISPIAFGYIFGGWYKEPSCKTPWDFKNTYVKKNTTLYAKWIAVEDTTPRRPENVEITENTGKTVSLSWLAVDGAESYNIYCNGVKVNSKPILETEYKVTALNYSSTYEFVVTAVNAKGESDNSIIVASNTQEDPRHEFDGHFYLVIDDNMSWSSAKSYAEAQGGYLACITSQKEQDFAHSLLVETGKKDNYWIGFTDENNAGKYIWVTGEKSGFTNWGEGQPDNYQEAEHYTVLTRDGKWNDLHNTDESTGLIIEWDSKAGKYPSNTQKIPEYPPKLVVSSIPGDVSGDGQVTAEDARLALRGAVGLEKYAEGSPEFLAADADKNGVLEAADARLILRAAVGLETLA